MNRLSFIPGLLAASAFIAACSSPSSAPASASAMPGTAPALLGDMKPVVSVKELMHDMIDPASDFVFDAVGTIIINNHREEIQPRTDADWDRIRFGAVTMAEGVYLLKIPRPFTPPGDNNNSEGPEAPELSPAQIKAKVDMDPVLWNAKIEALRNVNLEVLELVKKKDIDGLWQAEEDLDQACENCHVEYWYPGEPALLRKLDRRLEELYGKRTSQIGMEPPSSKKEPPKK